MHSTYRIYVALSHTNLHHRLSMLPPRKEEESKLAKTFFTFNNFGTTQQQKRKIPN